MQPKRNCRPSPIPFSHNDAEGTIPYSNYDKSLTDQSRSSNPVADAGKILQIIQQWPVAEMANTGSNCPTVMRQLPGPLKSLLLVHLLVMSAELLRVLLLADPSHPYPMIGPVGLRRPFHLESNFGNLSFGKPKRTSPSSSNGSQGSYKQEPHDNLNGACAATPHYTPNSWSDCSSYGAYSPSMGYETPHQDVSTMHIPTTVLSDATSTEFLNTSLTRNSPPSFIGHKSDLLESTITSRSYQDTPYCPNSWTTPYHPTTCNNNYYNNTAYNAQHFNTPSPAVVYPAIISTVNQNQIHFHLHPTASDVSRSEYFLPDSVSSEIPRVDLVPTTVREVATAHGVTASMQEGAREENAVQDPSNVWRPY
ncbi:hypothetical protein HUJ05_010739 [Dendroctonus ponderosae]|nr:hypothetical protein HUJ05_010739 [Dendroctonus ponderosae]